MTLLGMCSLYAYLWLNSNRDVPGARCGAVLCERTAELLLNQPARRRRALGGPRLHLHLRLPQPCPHLRLI